jgi:hypothetical protein
MKTNPHLAILQLIVKVVNLKIDKEGPKNRAAIIQPVLTNPGTYQIKLCGCMGKGKNKMMTTLPAEPHRFIQSSRRDLVEHGDSVHFSFSNRIERESYSGSYAEGERDKLPEDIYHYLVSGEWPTPDGTKPKE